MEACPKKRAAYQEKIKDVEPEKLVFIDESGIDRNIHRQKAWGKKEEIICAKRSGKYYQRVNIVAGLRGKKAIAPMRFSDPCNTEVFNLWVENFLLKELEPGQIVIMDNATFHKSKRTEELIKSVGCKLLFLPPYSPDLNPIEKFWSHMKRFLRFNLCNFKNLFHAIDYFFL